MLLTRDEARRMGGKGFGDFPSDLCNVAAPLSFLGSDSNKNLRNDHLRANWDSGTKTIFARCEDRKGRPLLHP